MFARVSHAVVKISIIFKSRKKFSKPFKQCDSFKFCENDERFFLRSENNSFCRFLRYPSRPNRKTFDFLVRV